MTAIAPCAAGLAGRAGRRGWHICSTAMQGIHPVARQRCILATSRRRHRHVQPPIPSPAPARHRARAVPARDRGRPRRADARLQRPLGPGRARGRRALHVRGLQLVPASRALAQRIAGPRQRRHPRLPRGLLGQPRLEGSLRPAAVHAAPERRHAHQRRALRVHAAGGAGRPRHARLARPAGHHAAGVARGPGRPAARPHGRPDSR